MCSLQCQVNPESGDPEDELTPDAVEFCRRLGSNATRVSELAGGRDRAIHAAIQDGINRVNEKATSNAQRIQKWIVLDRDFSVTGGELGEWDGIAGSDDEGIFPVSKSHFDPVISHLFSLQCVDIKE